MQIGLMSAPHEYEARAQAGERPWDADDYRARARTLRKLARWVQSPEVRRDLIALALRHEVMADYLERRSSEESPSS